MVASGCTPPDALLTDTTLGALVTPSYTYRPQRGRAATVRETVGGILHSPSPATDGITMALRRHARAWGTAAMPVVVSLLVDERQGYAAAASELEGVRGPVAIELNLAWGAADGLVAEDPSLIRQTVHAVRRVCQLPVLVKLPYDLADPEGALRACSTAGAAAVVVASGVPTSDGMLVGPATFPLLLEMVRRLSRDAPLPLVACGGVATPGQARAYLEAGAAAVQVGSAHLANPRAGTEIAQALALGG
jgi:dihydroorotate dehydrogenase (NAD+) catalytic subunit